MFSFDEHFEAYDTTPVSNLFITDYLPGCNGDELKVYLYGLMRCHHPRQDFALEDMARALEMDLRDVQTAMRHWEYEGLVERVSDKPPVYRFRHPASAAQENRQTDSLYESFMEDLYNAFGGRRDLHGYEKRKAWEWVTVQGLPQEVVMVMIKHLIKTQGRDFRFLGKETRRVVNLLQEEKAHTIEEAITVLARDEEIEAGARAVIRRFRQRRLPSEDELALYKKWRHEWGFSDEEILEACAETTKGTPNFGYLDGILSGIRERASTPKADREQQALVREMLRALGIQNVGVNSSTIAVYKQLTALYPHEVILMAARELSTRKNKGLDVLASMLESWKTKGIETADQAKTHIDVFNRENELIIRLNSLWEADLIRMGDASRAKVHTWLTDWGFSPEIVLYCAAFAGVNEKKSPMAYLDSILKSYHDKSLTTEAAIAAEHERWAAEHAAVPAVEAHQKANKAIAQLQYDQREYEDRKPGELPAWLREMMEEEQHAN